MKPAERSVRQRLAAMLALAGLLMTACAGAYVAGDLGPHRAADRAEPSLAPPPR